MVVVTVSTAVDLSVNTITQSFGWIFIKLGEYVDCRAQKTLLNFGWLGLGLGLELRTARLLLTGNTWRHWRGRGMRSSECLPVHNKTRSTGAGSEIWRGRYVSDPLIARTVQKQAAERRASRVVWRRCVEITLSQVDSSSSSS